MPDQPELDSEMDPEMAPEIALAIACTKVMHEQDTLSKHCDMVPESTAPGDAIVTMSVKEFMLNGHGTCHGGMIFALADTAFAHASNNHNEANVAMDCRIDYLYPAYLDDALVATARQTHQGRRSSLFEIKVTNQDDRNIAFFQGRSYAINRPVIEDKS